MLMAGDNRRVKRRSDGSRQELVAVRTSSMTMTMTMTLEVGVETRGLVQRFRPEYSSPQVAFGVNRLSGAVGD